MKKQLHSNFNMKCALLCFISFFILDSSFILSQGVWSPRASLPDSSRDGAIGFAIGNYGYMGIGVAPGKVPHPNYKDFWRFNPSTNSWTQMAQFPGLARGFPATFVIGNYGYVVTGIDSNLITCTNQCWQYNATTNKWTRKANFPGDARAFGVGFAIGHKGYVGLGSPDNYNSYKDFYAYDTITNSWTQIADFGGIPKITASGFSSNGTGYVCFGEDSTGKFYKDIWAYDTGANSWIQKSNCPDTDSYEASGFVIGKNIFIGTGQDSTALCLNQFWQYNTVNNIWIKVTNFPNIRCACSAFSIGDTGYFGLGVNEYSNIKDYYNDLYRFFPYGTGVNNLTFNSQPSVFPNPFSSECVITIPNESSTVPEFSLFNMGGEKQKIEIEGNGSNYILKKNNLEAGVYILSIKCYNEVYYKKLVIIN